MENESLIRILLVDDDEDCRLLIKDAMVQGRIFNEAYDVSSAEEALEFLYHRGRHSGSPPVGLIFLDIEMPGMSGQDLLRLLRADKRFDHVPVVMMTNLQDDREKSAAARAGANSYTIKPTDPRDFISSVVETTHYWIGIHQRPSEQSEAVPTDNTVAG